MKNNLEEKPARFYVNAFIQLRLFVERVLKIVGVLAVGDVDHHFSRKAHQLSCARIGDDRDRQLQCAARHCATVQKHEATAATLERPADPLNCDVTGRSIDTGASSEHLAL